MFFSLSITTYFPLKAPLDLDEEKEENILSIFRSSSKIFAQKEDVVRLFEDKNKNKFVIKKLNSELGLSEHEILKKLNEHDKENRYFIKLYNKKTPKIIEGFLYMIMEYVENDLNVLKRKFGESNHMTEEIFFSIFVDCVAALSMLNDLGIAHMDIKPQNIVADKHDRIKLIDFGNSETLKSQEEKEITVLGTVVLGFITIYSFIHKFYLIRLNN